MTGRHFSRIGGAVARSAFRLFLFTGIIIIADRAGAVSVDDFIPLAYTNGSAQVLPYRLFVPTNYVPSGRFPLVLFFHGAGERGTDNRNQLAGQTAELVFVQPQNQSNWPCFMMAPQCPGDQQWVDMPWGDQSGTMPASPTWPMASTIAAMSNVLASYSGIDTTRLYVTGLSIGGYGTWDAVIRYPGRWKAAVPICGGGDPNTVAPIVNLSIWAFHAADDPVVPVVRSRSMIAAIRALGGNPVYTEYPASLGYGHGSWIPAYADTNLLPWLFDTSAPVITSLFVMHGICRSCIRLSDYGEWQSHGLWRHRFAFRPERQQFQWTNQRHAGRCRNFKRNHYRLECIWD